MSVDAYAEQSPVEQLFGSFASAKLPVSHHSPALQNSLVVFTGPCYVLSVQVANTNAAAQFVQMFDSTTVPADGATPTKLFTVSASSDKFATWSLPGVFFGTGVAICNSSTAATKTVGAADCFFDVQVIPVIWE